MKVLAVVHGVPCEPLVSQLTLPQSFLTSPRAWVIAEGESGHRKTVRSSRPDWFSSLRDQAVEAGAAFHFKQWGKHNGDLLDGRTWDGRP